MLVKTRDLTAGERLLIARRRIRRKTQAKAAAEHGVHFAKYAAWEKDQGDDIPSVKVGRLEEHEQCFILRRREDLTQDALAEALGCSVNWLCMMERGDAPVARLLAYWTE